jgi:hypothetical protein
MGAEVFARRGRNEMRNPIHELEPALGWPARIEAEQRDHTVDVDQHQRRLDGRQMQGFQRFVSEHERSFRRSDADS